MAVLLPALDEVSGKPRMGKMKLMDEFKRTGQSTENLVALVNKQPVWDASKNSASPPHLPSSARHA